MEPAFDIDDISLNDYVDISLDIRDPHKQTIKVTIKCYPKENEQIFSMPIWTPGSYTVRDHVQNLFDLKITQNDTFLLPLRLSPSKWLVEVVPNTEIKLTYCIEARSLTVRTSYLDEDFASLCLSGIILQINGLRQLRHRLTIEKENHWNLFVPLPGSEYFWASNYDHLIDSPVHAGDVTSIDIYVGNFKHEFILIGNQLEEMHKDLIADISAIFSATCDLMKSDPPSGNQYQLILIMLENSYGGLEHDDSCVLHFGWKRLKKENGYRKLLQLIGHEYLHQWNVRRLRPIEYIEYDYSKEVVTDSLWFAEGVTSYFDLAIPLIAGLTNEELLISDLSYEINILLNTPGRFYQSIADSSREAWVKLYKSTPASKDTQVSYYNIGTLLSFCLDVSLRKVNSSLSDLLRNLWIEYGINRKGYSRDNIIDLVRKVDHDLSIKLSNWIDQCDSLPISSIVKDLGYQLVSSDTPRIDIGLTCININGLVKVTRVSLNSTCEEAKLIVGDEIIAIDKHKVRSIEDIYELVKSNKKLQISFFRNGILRETVMKISNQYQKSWELKPCSNKTEQQTSLMENWIKII